MEIVPVSAHPHEQVKGFRVLDAGDRTPNELLHDFVANPDAPKIGSPWSKRVPHLIAHSIRVTKSMPGQFDVAVVYGVPPIP